MPDLFLLFSHTITPLQEEQAYTELGVENLIPPPMEIKNLWAAIPPGEKALLPFLQPVISWLDQNAEKGDFILIQGDFGACYLMAQYALQNWYVPIYSTTERKAVEKILSSGEVQLTHTFMHVRFRKYGR